MIRTYIPLLVFIILLITMIPPSLDFATSVIPGWHTTIIPPLAIIEISIFIILLVILIAYWNLYKQISQVNFIVCFIHFLFTVPLILFNKILSSALPFSIPEELGSTTSFWLSILLFSIGQLVFGIYFYKNYKRNGKYQSTPRH